MGGLINSIFGGNSNKTSKQALANQQAMYTDTKNMVTPWSDTGLGAYKSYMDSLTGGPDGMSGFNNYLNSGDYKFAMKAGTDAIENSQAAKGLMRSGATLKGMDAYGQNLGMQYRDNYLNHLFGGAQLGENAVGQLAGANQANANAQTNILQAKSQGAANGVGNMLNTAVGVASLFSDRRLKSAIKRVGQFLDGLGIYEFNYVPEGRRWRGVMADEVAKLRPWALGPTVGGFQTVNYGRL